MLDQRHQASMIKPYLSQSVMLASRGAGIDIDSLRSLPGCTWGGQLDYFQRLAQPGAHIGFTVTNGDGGKGACTVSGCKFGVEVQKESQQGNGRRQKCADKN